MTKLKKKTKFKNTPKDKKEQKVEITIPALSEYVGVARLAISGIASRLNFSVEQVEDIKVAVTEACSNAVQYAYAKNKGATTDRSVIILCKAFPNRLEIFIKDKGCGFDIHNPPKPEKDDGHTHLGLGITFMKTLMDEININSKINLGTEVKLVKYITSQKSI